MIPCRPGTELGRPGDVVAIVTRSGRVRVQIITGAGFRDELFARVSGLTEYGLELFVMGSEYAGQVSGGRGIVPSVRSTERVLIWSAE